MATLNERLAFLISVNADQAIRAFEQTGQSAERNLGKAESRLDRVSGNMTKFGAGALAAAGVAGRGLFALAESAGNVNAAFAANEQVLGDAADAVKDWSEDSVEAVGLSQRAAIEATTSFGGLAKAAGMTGQDVANFSIEMTQLAADMAAFKDVSPAQALQDLQAGFAGSTEVLRKYNIFLDDAGLKQAYFRATGEEVTGTLSAQQRIIASHQAIMEQTVDIQGQWARESDSLAANQAKLSANLENLKANIGQGVLPVMNDMVGTLSSAAGAFGNLDPAAQSAVGTVATYATVAAGAVGGISLLAGQTLKLRDRFTTLGDDGSRSLNKFGRAARGASIALGALAIIEVADEAIRGFTDSAGEAEQAMNDLITAAGNRTAEETMKALGEASRATASDTSLLEKAMGRLGGGFEQVELGAAGGTVELSALKDTIEEIIATAPELAGSTLQALEEYLATLDEGSITYFQLSELIDTYRGRLESQAAAQRTLNQTTQESAGPLQGAAQNLTDVANAAGETAEEINQVEVAFKSVREELGERDEYLGLIDTLDDVKEAEKEAAKAASEGQADAAAKARDHESAMIGLRQKVIDYGQQIEALPPERVTEILAAIDAEDYARVEFLLDQLEKDRVAEIRIREIREVTQNVRVGDRRARAAGGPVFPGNDYLVGEHGPEVVRFDGAGDVWPAGVRPPREGSAVPTRILHVENVYVTNGRSWAEEMAYAEALYGQGL